MTPGEEDLKAEEHIRSRNRIVVGIDGSPCSIAALQWGAEEARIRNAELVAVHVWHLPYVGVPGLSPPYPKDEFRDLARRVLEEATAQIPAAADARMEVVEGHAGAVLTDMSREASLLVVGSHGHGVMPGTLLGSVAHRVAMHAACPVVIVRLER